MKSTKNIFDVYKSMKPSEEVKSIENVKKAFLSKIAARKQQQNPTSVNSSTGKINEYVSDDNIAVKSQRDMLLIGKDNN